MDERSATNDRELMKGVYTFLKHKEFLHKIKGRYIANHMKDFFGRKVKTETFDPLKLATACYDGIISRKVFTILPFGMFSHKSVMNTSNSRRNVLLYLPFILCKNSLCSETSRCVEVEVVEGRSRRGEEEKRREEKKSRES